MIQPTKTKLKVAIKVLLAIGIIGILAVVGVVARKKAKTITIEIAHNSGMLFSNPELIKGQKGHVLLALRVNAKNLLNYRNLK